VPHPLVAHPGSDAGRGAAASDPVTLAAFFATALLGGGNAVAIRLGNLELAPFWGAALRFLPAALILLIVVAVMRLELPRGRAAVGVALYGLFSFGLGFGFAYLALREVTAGTGQVGLALAPLLTTVLAAVQGVERFRLAGFIGALVAAVGIILIFGDSVATASPLALGSLIASVVCMAEVPIIVKKFPHIHPIVENAFGMAIGGLFLLVLSIVAREPLVIPHVLGTQISVAYLILVGSVVVFVLYLFVLGRWTASAASYVLLVMPLFTIVIGYIVLGEEPSPIFLVGGVLVIAGVFVGIRSPVQAKGGAA